MFVVCNAGRDVVWHVSHDSGSDARALNDRVVCTVQSEGAPRGLHRNTVLLAPDTLAGPSTREDAVLRQLESLCSSVHHSVACRSLGMTEQMFRQPLSVLPIARPAQNIKVNSPSLSGKRTYDSAGLELRGNPSLGNVTPTKASATKATNGRRSVKRMKPDVTVREDTELSMADLRAKAEEEHAAKLRIWIASYKKQFPSLRFFFDACSDDDVRRCTRKILALGGVRWTIEPLNFTNLASLWNPFLATMSTSS